MRFLETFLGYLLPTPGTDAWVVFAAVLTAILGNFLLFCMAFYAVVLVRRVWRTLAALPQLDRAPARVPLLKRTVSRFGVVYLAWWVAFAALGYWSDATARTDAKDCERITSPEYKDYYVDECSVRGGKGGYRILLRLYAVGNNELLAEEFVSNAEGPLRWKKSQTDETGKERLTTPYITQWGGSEDGAYAVSIFLPPPWLDRMRAKLP